MGELNLNRVKSFYLENNWLYGLTPEGREQKKLLKILHSFTEGVSLFSCYISKKFTLLLQLF